MGADCGKNGCGGLLRRGDVLDSPGCNRPGSGSGGRGWISEVNDGRQRWMGVPGVQ